MARRQPQPPLFQIGSVIPPIAVGDGNRDRFLLVRVAIVVPLFQLRLARPARLLPLLLDTRLPQSLNDPTARFDTHSPGTFRICSSLVSFFLTLPKIPFPVNPSAECGY
jgi:hypothetical protein